MANQKERACSTKIDFIDVRFHISLYYFIFYDFSLADKRDNCGKNESKLKTAFIFSVYVVKVPSTYYVIKCRKALVILQFKVVKVYINLIAKRKLRLI